ncbi:activator of HSP90 ATPase [Parapedobacter defluvii]|uniref:Activator of HSP90 ATPase n=1 Tax=Parapedobacter defluvii TaxID=2045106 RepID=A0ABQ1M3C3_9SPHI|nr:SRPBCC family protein [Parapedobacter defluvii]RQP08708.1 MAG: polyketide cyclase [Parapedobacter sp.]GGC33637.1 activator of HSP90 ATPase [Parapedobacter defluvii]
MNATKITVEATVKAPVEKVWERYTSPEHIVKWNSASDDWHTTKAENDVRTGGKFLSRMEAKDGSFGFDFEGVYDDVAVNKRIAYTMTDGRKAEIIFMGENNETKMTVTFDAENENPIGMQREGWQAILDSFKKYTEAG